jgi:putative membrane protein
MNEAIPGLLSEITGLVLHRDGPWTWRFHPDIWLVVLSLQGGYLLAITRLAPAYLRPGERAASPRHFVLFSLGVLLLWTAIDGPIHTLSEGYLYSVHMIQHMLLTLIVPPLLLMGTPGWLLRLLLSPRPIIFAARYLTRPVVGLVVFNAVMILTHLPPVVDLTLRNEFAHVVMHGVMIGAGLVMWFPVVSPLEELPRMSYPASMLYLFGQSILPTVPASFLTFSTIPLYSFYEEVPRLGGISVVTDQRIGGLIMKVGGGFYLWTIITVLFFKWYSEEESPEGERLKWEDVERELEDMGLTKR